MRLIANALHQVEALSVAWQHDGIAETGHEDLFALFGQRHHRHDVRQVKRLQHFNRHAQLPFAAINHNKIRQQCPRWIVFLLARRFVADTVTG